MMKEEILKNMKKTRKARKLMKFLNFFKMLTHNGLILKVTGILFDPKLNLFFLLYYKLLIVAKKNSRFYGTS